MDENTGLVWEANDIRNMTSLDDLSCFWFVFPGDLRKMFLGPKVGPS